MNFCDYFFQILCIFFKKGRASLKKCFRCFGKLSECRYTNNSKEKNISIFSSIDLLSGYVNNIFCYLQVLSQRLGRAFAVALPDFF